MDFMRLHLIRLMRTQIQTKGKSWILGRLMTLGEVIVFAIFGGITILETARVYQETHPSSFIEPAPIVIIVTATPERYQIKNNGVLLSTQDLIDSIRNIFCFGNILPFFFLFSLGLTILSWLLKNTK